eukprot:16117008-Heterocapsa_arctica.AAC.1
MTENATMITVPSVPIMSSADPKSVLMETQTSSCTMAAVRRPFMQFVISPRHGRSDSCTTVPPRRSRDIDRIWAEPSQIVTGTRHMRRFRARMIES